MSALRLRDARPDDRAAIEALTIAAYEQYAVTMGPVWERYRENIVSTLRDVGSAEQIVAERDGRLIGAVLLYPAGAALPTPRETSALHWPEVRLLAVGPEARGQGVGKTLMDECLRRARSAGASAVTLHTTDMMRAAVRLYEAMGFVRAPELDFRPAPSITVKGYRLDF